MLGRLVTAVLLTVTAPVTCSPPDGPPAATNPAPPVTTTTMAPPRPTAGVRLWRVDAATLASVTSSAVGPVGAWATTVTAGDGEIAFVGYDHDSAHWSLWLLDTRNGRLRHLADRDVLDYAPFGIVLAGDHIDLLTFVERRGGIENVPDGFAVHRYDRATGTLTARHEILPAQGLFPDTVAVLADGRVGLSGRFGRTQDIRVLVVDVETGTIDLDATIAGVADPDGGDPMIEPAWDRGRDQVYVPHASGVVTTVDLTSGEVATREIAPRSSFWGRLRAAWLPAAVAKGPWTAARASLAPDGSLLYLTGHRLEWENGNYREVPLGVVAVDPATMEEVARTDLPVHRVAVSPRGDVILATGWWEDYIDGGGYSLGTAGLAVLDALTLEPLLAPVGTGTAPIYELAFSADGRYAYAAERDHAPANETPPRTLVIDTTDMTVAARPGLDRFDPALLQLGYVLSP